MTGGATSEPAADWAHFFNRPSSVPADSTVVTTSPVAAAAAAASRSVGKAPPRKRSRASRRAPTTLLNTDTTNFRAMVQQFTGVPSGPYSTDGLGLGFGFGPDNPIRQPPAAMQQQQRQYYQYRPPQQQPQQQQDVMHMGYGMDDGQVMPGSTFFIDGMGHGYTFNG